MSKLYNPKTKRYIQNTESNRNRLAELPSEMIGEILKYLPEEDASAFGSTSRRMRSEYNFHGTGRTVYLIIAPLNPNVEFYDDEYEDIMIYAVPVPKFENYLKNFQKRNDLTSSEARSNMERHIGESIYSKFLGETFDKPLLKMLDSHRVKDLKGPWKIKRTITSFIHHIW